MEKYTKTICGFDIAITKKSNIKNLYLRVCPPDGHITVTAPLTCSDFEIEQHVMKNIAKINKYREKLRNQPRQTERQYVSGESHYLWGKPCRLEVIYGKEKTRVYKVPNKIILEVPEGASFEKRKRAVTEWYRAELKRVIKNMVPRCEKKTGLKANEYQVRDMRTRWGTCHIKDKIICLNLNLVKRPMDCLEYMIIRELVHLEASDHTWKFKKLMDMYCPFWRSLDKELYKVPLRKYRKRKVKQNADELSGQHNMEKQR